MTHDSINQILMTLLKNYSSWLILWRQLLSVILIDGFLMGEGGILYLYPYFWRIYLKSFILIFKI